MFDRLKTAIKTKIDDKNSHFFTLSIRRLVIGISLTLLISYILASAVASFSVPVLIGLMDGKVKSPETPPAQRSNLLSDRPNFHQIRKVVIERNLFNVDGEYPQEEVVKKETKSQQKGKRFNENAACSPTKLKITLIGTIFLGSKGESMATVREQGYDEVDIYKKGEEIIGVSGAKVHDIQRNKIILNNNGNKECLEIKLGKFASNQNLIQNTKPSAQEVEGGMIILQASWVESQLGDGFGKVIQSARLVPSTEGNKVRGFKIFSIKSGSLFEKMGFKNGDVITQVNDTVMEAEQGFALYQALQEERDLNIRVLRNGKTPTSIRARIEK